MAPSARSWQECHSAAGVESIQRRFLGFMIFWGGKQHRGVVMGEGMKEEGRKEEEGEGRFLHWGET